MLSLHERSGRLPAIKLEKGFEQASKRLKHGSNEASRVAVLSPAVPLPPPPSPTGKRQRLGDCRPSALDGRLAYSPGLHVGLSDVGVFVGHGRPLREARLWQIRAMLFGATLEGGERCIGGMQAAKAHRQLATGYRM